MYKTIFKPSLDRLLALVMLLLLLPVITVLTVFLYVANDRKPFFTQIRPGKNAVLFKIVKFKTMNDRKDDQGNLLPDELRLTRTGALIRKTSLDELPQLFNVLKGDMSFVGPRPLLPEYLPLYSKEQARRHNVKPGMTGWAQVNGRNAISWAEKFNLDVWYVHNQSFLLDLKIMLLTVKKVIWSSGITDGKNATTTRFTGK